MSAKKPQDAFSEIAGQSQSDDRCWQMLKPWQMTGSLQGTIVQYPVGVLRRTPNKWWIRTYYIHSGRTYRKRLTCNDNFESPPLAPDLPNNDHLHCEFVCEYNQFYLQIINMSAATIQFVPITSQENLNEGCFEWCNRLKESQLECMYISRNRYLTHYMVFEIHDGAVVVKRRIPVELSIRSEFRVWRLTKKRTNNLWLIHGSELRIHIIATDSTGHCEDIEYKVQSKNSVEDCHCSDTDHCGDGLLKPAIMPLTTVVLSTRNDEYLLWFGRFATFWNNDVWIFCRNSGRLYQSVVKFGGLRDKHEFVQAAITSDPRREMLTTCGYIRRNWHGGYPPQVVINLIDQYWSHEVVIAVNRRMGLRREWNVDSLLVGH